MGLKDELEKALYAAMKEKDQSRRDVLRMALSAIKQNEIDSQSDLDDVNIFSILQKEIKMREETIAEAQKAERTKMIIPLEEEILILKEFLPKELSDEELKTVVLKIIDQENASTMRDIGRVMKQTIAEVSGKASNNRISKIVKDLLAQ